MPIDPDRFARGSADARAGIRRSASALDRAHPDYVAGYLAATPVDGASAADMRAPKPAALAERLYAAASRLEIPLAVPSVTRAAVALLGPGAEAVARRRARALFDQEIVSGESAAGAGSLA